MLDSNDDNEDDNDDVDDDNEDGSNEATCNMSMHNTAELNNTNIVAHFTCNY